MSIDPADVVTALAQHLDDLNVAVFSETFYPEDTDGVPFIYFGLLPDTPDLAVTINPYLTDPDIDTTLHVLPAIIEKLAAMSPYDKELAARR